MKGISPLISVIMLIAFALIVSGIVINWGISFAETKRTEIQFCSKTQIIMERTYYSQGNINVIVRNIGRVPLAGFNVLLFYSNGTVESSGNRYDGYGVGENEIITLRMSSWPDLEKVMVQSKQCKEAQDLVLAHEISGL
jgi:flagellin-like protein